MKILIDTGPSPHGWHYYSTFMQCEQLWEYKQAGKLPPLDEEALQRGSFMHVALAHHFTPNPAYYLPTEAINEYAKKNLKWTRLAAPTVDLLLRYQHHYMADLPFQGVRVETLLEMKFGEAPYTARVDLIPRIGDKVFFWDHKTTRRITPEWKNSFTNSGQIIGLTHLGRYYFGDAFGGVVINGIGWQNTEFTRFAVPPSPYAESRFPALIESLWQDMNTPKLPRGRLPRLALNCHPYNKPCPALNLCRWGENEKESV